MASSDTWAKRLCATDRSPKGGRPLHPYGAPALRMPRNPCGDRQTITGHFPRGRVERPAPPRAVARGVRPGAAAGLPEPGPISGADRPGGPV